MNARNVMKAARHVSDLLIIDAMVARMKLCSTGMKRLCAIGVVMDM